MSLVEVRDIRTGNGKEAELKVVASSRSVAQSFYKRHDEVYNLIGNILNDSRKNIEIVGWIGAMFSKYNYVDDNGQACSEILMNKDGFYLVAMNYTDKEFIEQKIRYINAFNLMEKQLIIDRYKYEYMRDFEHWQNMLEILKNARKRGEEDLKKTIEFYKDYIPADLLKTYSCYSQ